MNKPVLQCLMLLSLNFTAAQAQVSLRIEIGLPIAPPLVVVRPGIQVVEGFQDEVFFHRGWYWCRRPHGWYRARQPQARFEWVEGRHVPSVLVRMPVGHYRNWRRDERHEERREERRDRHKEARRDDRRDDRRGRDKEHKRH